VTDQLAVLVVAVAAYWAGRLRPGQRLLDRAEDRADGPHGPAWWAAQAVLAVAVAWVLTTHPRRSATNRRAWREARNAPLSPALTFDRKQTEHRKDTP